MNKRAGFTLVELSIVLVIIGLLIGGILVAQSMIASVRVLGVLDDLGKYEISVNNFRQMYKQIPGDSNFFTPRGTNDGVMYYGTGGDFATCSAAPDNLYHNMETYQNWSHLSQAKMLDANYPPLSISTCGGTHNFTDFERTNINGTLGPLVYVEKSIINKGGNNKFFMFRNTPESNLAIQLHVTPMDGLALETKLGTVVNTDNAIGLGNIGGDKNCVVDLVGYVIVPCTHSTAGIAIYNFRLAPL